MNKISAALVLLLTAGSASAEVCPNIPPAPRTIIDTAENYSKSSGFSLNSEGILQYDYGAHHGGRANGQIHFLSPTTLWPFIAIG